MAKTKFELVADKNILKNIHQICGYLEIDEAKHYEECGKPSGHIYRNVLKLKKWLKSK